MKQKINVLTIGVTDLERSLIFYRDGLGLKTRGIIGEEFENKSIVFFDFNNEMKLALYQRKSIASDCGIKLQPPSSTEFSIAHLVNSAEEVDDIMMQAQAAGATILKKAKETTWGGYGGYFEDPDGHVWEIAYDPRWEIKSYLCL